MAAPPTTPGNFSASVYSSSALELFWDDAEDDSGVKSYRVSQNGSVINTLDANSLFLDGLRSGTEYGFSVTAIDFDGEQSSPASVSVRTRSNWQEPEPVSESGAAPPTDSQTGSVPSFSVAVYSSTALELFWDRSNSDTGISGYEIRVGSRELAVVDATSLFIEQLSPNTTYQFTIAAIDRNNARLAQSVVTAKTNKAVGSVQAGPEPAPEPAPVVPSEPSTTHYKPQVLITWQLQLQGTLNTNYNVELYIADLFDTSAADIATIQSRGRKVICYFSAGTYEEWRRDASQFNASDLGRNLADWPGERWLDVRSSNVKNVMTSRLDLARSKGCDGVDPDNVDGFSNSTGINLTGNEQLAFNRFLSNEAHQRGLAIGLKNNVGQVEALVDYYDFAVNESCDRYNECDRLNAFISQGKPVFHVEYRPDLRNNIAGFNEFCQQFNDRQFSSLILPRMLDDEFRLSCQ